MVKCLFRSFVATCLLFFIISACANPANETDQISQRPLSLVQEVYEKLEADYIDNLAVNEEEMSIAAVKGLLATLDDPYTAYLDPSQMEVHGDFSGKYEGIGAHVAMRNGQFVIVAPIPDSPASISGIKAGDLVLSVDGEALKGKSLYDAVLMIRGPKGTKVILEVVHEGSIAPHKITIERKPITIPSVEWQQYDQDIGVIRVSTFSENTADQLRIALDSSRIQDIQGIILDLRDNGGGLLSAAVDVASEFLSDGLILTSKDSSGTETRYTATGEASVLDIPIVILVNGNTASAAEVVAGALQDQGRADLVGTKTFGKGSVTWMVPLSTGAGLNYTIARWFTPKGTLIELNGLTPDLIVGANGPDYRHESVRELSQLVPPLCQTFSEAQDHLGEDSHLSDPLKLLCSPPALPREETEADFQLESAVELLRRRL